MREINKHYEIIKSLNYRFNECHESHFEIGVQIVRKTPFQFHWEDESNVFAISKINYVEFTGQLDFEEFDYLRNSYLDSLFKFCAVGSYLDQVMCLMINENLQLKSVRESKEIAYSISIVSSQPTITDRRGRL